MTAEKLLRQKIAALERRRDQLRGRLGRRELTSSLARQRATAVAKAVLWETDLDRRLETLFDHTRAKNWRDSGQSVVRVIDGLVARFINRRLLLVVLGILTLVPAIGSLILLFQQNQSMIRKNAVEESVDLEKDRRELREIIHANQFRLTGDVAAGNLINEQRHPSRLRSESISSLITLEKQRWTKAELETWPVTRRVDLRNGEFANLVLGRNFGVRLGTNDEMTRVSFDRSRMFRTKIYAVPLDGSSFRGVDGLEMEISVSSAREVDFTNLQAPRSTFAWNAFEAEPMVVENSTFDHANFQNSSWDQVLLKNCSFRKTDLRGLNLQLVYFIDCDLTHAKLGESLDLASTASNMHRCLVTEAQSKKIILPPSTTFEKTETPGLLHVMSKLPETEP